MFVKQFDFTDHALSVRMPVRVQHNFSLKYLSGLLTLPRFLFFENLYFKLVLYVASGKMENLCQ